MRIVRVFTLASLAVSTMASLSLLGCGQAAQPADMGEVDSAVPPAPVTVGEDLDVRTPRTLTSTCKLPQSFYDALTSFSVTPQDLKMPDWGVAFANEPNRLHWTDELRHQGDLAPDFAC